MTPVIIGHTIGFDLAMWPRNASARDCRSRNRASLDTQFLAQLVDPRLTGQSLGELADWLSVEITDRHSALGDALTTAHVFQAMVPKLREGGIRTYAEAAQACRSLTDAIDRQYRAGWMTSDAARIAIPAGTEPDRQLPVSPPHPRCHVVAAENHRCRQDAWRGVSQLIAARVSSLLVAPPGLRRKSFKPIRSAS